MPSLAAPISNKVKNIWDKWNLRSFIILSLSLQTFLILFAPLRKRTSSKWVIVPIWLAYLLADWAANFAIGLIASSQTNTDQGSPENGNLLTFWAPFLLLHLGGPDTIIAIAMEDNALWPRHLLGLIFQVVAAMYVFGMQFSNQNKLLWPTLLLFVPGLVKYGERTRALYLASLESLKETILAIPEPGPDYAKYMDEYSSRKAAHLPIKIEIEEGRSSDSKNVTYQLGEGDTDNITLVEGAYHLFQISMGLIIDLVFDYHQRNESRAYFNKLKSEEAFTSIATELNFMYEALYTKAYVVHSRRGYLLRATSFIAVCIALIFFYRLEKHGFHMFDVGLTYSLLFGAIALDSIALLMLILSDWTIAVVYKFCKEFSLVTGFVMKYLDFKRSWRPTTTPTPKCLEWTRKFLFRRWCESVSGFSFIDYSLRECGRVVRPGDRFDLFYLYRRFIRFLGHRYIQIIRFFGLKYLRDEMKYRSSKRLAKKLWNFIFEELQKKSLKADDDDDPKIAKTICSSQGDWVLRERYKEHPEYTNLLSYEELQSCFVDVTYDRRILLWHIATEMCYYGVNTGNGGEHGEFSKTLSDYMLYLLIMQPALMSSVAGIGQKRFRDTVAEAKKFFKKRGLGSDVKLGKEELGKACCKLLDVDTGVKPVDVKGNRSKSVLFDARILAGLLMKFGDSKWELISAVWVELLSYAASHCRAHSHAQLLTKGGELVTFVWLLMARFGIEEDIQVLEVQARVKLIMEKQPDVFQIK
ncbi:uncharacterized protein LOC133707515 [Rosa rugosa]|uniref:uncharacterized protein LOC133707515 n=1 Tax=Rosa rugosa TaxID=74645 RepID=UPI002B406340|nr:uncharacterized protein LOC133707515 [Rosa rugosa]